MAAQHRPIRLSPDDVLLHTEDYFAVGKRAGWPVHATVDPKRPDLFRAAQAYLKSQRDGQDAYLALHHRLDVWTSGVVLFACSRRANSVLGELFKTHRIEKRYRALVAPAPPAESGELSHFLAKKRVDGRDRMVAVRSGGKKAITRYRIVERLDERALLELELVTGRMHQIRAQCALAGFAVVNDPLYGDAPVERGRGQRLHAHRLCFDDPLSGATIEIEAPLPPAFLDLDEPRAAVRDRYLAFYKPYDVLSQFTPDRPGQRTLAEFGLPRGVHPVGRLDRDSEGLLLLTSDGAAQARLSNPRHHREKCYWVQVEGIPTDEALARLGAGVTIRGHRTRPCVARRIGEPTLPERDPPIRKRAAIPTAWIEVILTEGKNRQVRRMTAAVGHPTLRLVRARIDDVELGDLRPGNVRELDRF